VKLAEFERIALACFERVPDHFRSGIDALVIEQGSRSHPHIADYLTLGECVHRAQPDPEAPLFSTIVLYYGSFLKSAKRDPSFDLAAEIEETVLHEILHNLEDRAGASALADEDALEEMNERRRAGLPFVPTFYRHGEVLEEDVHAVGEDVFIEARVSRRNPPHAGATLRVRFGGEQFDVTVPELVQDVTFVEIDGGWEADDGSAGDLYLVLVKAPRGTGP
jgi:predicted Zn-dependent protease with MMP-like domain